MDTFQYLALPVFALISVSALFGSILQHCHGPCLQNGAMGAFFGATVILAMVFPVTLLDGLFVDLRGLIVGVAVVFGGIFAGVVTVVAGMLYRVYVGGVGMSAGILTLLIAFGIGIAWRRFGTFRKARAGVIDLGFGVLITLSLGSVVMLPADMAWQVLMDVGVPLLIANALGAICIGFILRRETETISTAREQHRLATQDPLTRLLNRRGALELIDATTPSPCRGRAVLYFDLDRFKGINDTFGHATGDLALQHVAGCIVGSARENEIVSRHGGDEFMVYLCDVHHQDIAVIAERFRRAVIQKRFVVNGEDIPLTISIGVCWSARSASFETLLATADAQLLTAKAEGRNRACVAYDTPSAPTEASPHIMPSIPTPAVSVRQPR